MGRTQDILAIIRSKPDHLVVRALDELLPRWIPVEERLPDEVEPVIVWLPDIPHNPCGMDIGSYMMASYGVDWMVSDGRSAFPSHWMPLPEPPPLAAPDLTPDAVAALREEWENLNKGPRQHVEIVTLPKPPEVK